MRLKIALVALALLAVVLVGCNALHLAEPVSYGPHPAEAVEGAFGTHPNDVRIGDFYPGAIVDTWLEDDELGFYKVGDPFGIVIHNKLDAPQAFHVYACSPLRPPRFGSMALKAGVQDYERWIGKAIGLEGYGRTLMDLGYVGAPDYVIEEWIFIPDSYPVLEPREVRLIPVALAMPRDAEVFAAKWEFQIAVAQIEGETVVEGLTQRFIYKGRWLVDMRQ